jgi:hypothetical protein
MSLDVSLIGESPIKRPASPGIFIREDGHTFEITEEEWNRRYPDRKPVKAPQQDEETNELYWANITHNLGQMASHAGLYRALWRPEEEGWTHARDIIAPLEVGIVTLKNDPDLFKQYDSDNGWGTYEQFVPFVEEYLAACKRWPDAKIEVSR